MSGIYIHIPFCAKKCSYCDFHFSTTFASYRTKMVDALVKEITLRKHEGVNQQLETIYFGGGTPSILSIEELDILLQSVKTTFTTDPLVEITLECNPDDCTTEKLHAWKNLGVNRLSIGIQTFEPKQLAWMNRTHDANDGLAAVKRAIATGFDNLTVDLMYGLPDMSREEWEQQIHQFASLNIQHISAYCLTIEERTPLAAWVKKGMIHPVDADLQSEQFERLVTCLSTYGFEQYEISNFARNGSYSKHNSSYWKGNTYIAIGPSAHGYDGVSRYWNCSNNHEYMRSVERNSLPETREILSNQDRFNELLLIGLRTVWGVDKNELFQCLEPSSEWFTILNKYLNTEQLSETTTHYQLTQKGKLLADAIASDLFVID